MLDRFLRGNFSRKFWGWRGQKFLGKNKTFLTRKFSGKISSPKISSGNFGSNSPSRGNFQAQNFLETRGNLTRKLWDHLIIELVSVPYLMMPTTYIQLTVFSAVLTHASSHTNIAPRALTNVRGRTAVLAGMMIDFFCFQSGLVT